MCCVHRTCVNLLRAHAIFTFDIEIVSNETELIVYRIYRFFMSFGTIFTSRLSCKQNEIVTIQSLVTVHISLHENGMCHAANAKSILSPHCTRIVRGHSSKFSFKLFFIERIYEFSVCVRMRNVRYGTISGRLTTDDENTLIRVARAKPNIKWLLGARCGRVCLSYIEHL